jgi:prepilin-type N-terminal cleavage/methylation domain-containing protein
VRRPAGFTILEIIVVLLLLSILAATLLGRSITSSDLDLPAQTDKLRNHLRFAQAEAMKLAYKDYPVWGINLTNSEYWLFRGSNINTKVRLPGVESDDVNLAAVGISAPTAPQTVYFDRIGKPYSAYTDATNNTPLASTMTIRLTTGGPPREIKITPETGLVQ